MIAGVVFSQDESGQVRFHTPIRPHGCHVCGQLPAYQVKGKLVCLIHDPEHGGERI